VLEVLNHRSRRSHVQCPDLLVYAADLSDWYFCEVKADSDSLRQEQLDFFEKLAKASGRPVALMKFERREGKT